MFDHFFATLKTFGPPAEQARRLGVTTRAIDNWKSGEIPSWLHRLRRNPELLIALLQDAQATDERKQSSENA
jgi:hypothetical protein